MREQLTELKTCGANLLGYVSSSIGRKQTLGAAGAALVLFLAGHAAGNLALLNPDPAAAQAAYNAYCQFLTGMKPLIWIVEAGLAAILLVHVALALALRARNRRARGGGTRYAVTHHAGPATPAAYTMFATGALVLAFLVQHLAFFKFGTWYLYRDAEGRLIRDMWLTAAETFAQPGWTALYVVALLLVGAHLVHALPSLFRTFGLVHPRWTPLVNLAGAGVAVALAGTFAATALGACLLLQRPAARDRMAQARAAQPALAAEAASAPKGVSK